MIKNNRNYGKKRLSKQSDLALTIMDKCKELGCTGPNDTAELLGGATLVILSTMGEYLGTSLDEMRNEYIRGLAAAEVD